MNPMVLAALMSFGPSLLSKLFGGQSSGQQAMDKIRALYDPAYRAKMQAQYYQQNLQSPAYSQAQGTIAAGANQSASQIASSLGQTGMTPSGTGAIMSGMIPSMVGHNLAGLRTTAYNAGGTAADQSIEGMVRSILATQGPSQTQQMFGAGASNFSNFLSQYLLNKQPKVPGVPAVATPTYTGNGVSNYLPPNLQQAMNFFYNQPNVLGATR
jgi:hypothetical protein